jgi:hypothetical protein
VLLVSFEFLYLLLSMFLQGLFWGGMDALLLLMGLSQVWEMESVAVLAFVWGNVEGLIPKVALIEGELVQACRTGRWPKGMFAACQAHRLRVRDG